MRATMPVVDLMNSMVPVSRFNKGEASKIFDEVAETGMKIAINNNKPACVLLSPEMYESIMESFEDFDLIMEVERRLEEDTGPTFSREELMHGLGITQADIDAAEDVEIE